jgi:capsular polysaccharide biosynthesis protein
LNVRWFSEAHLSQAMTIISTAKSDHDSPIKPETESVVVITFLCDDNHR